MKQFEQIIPLLPRQYGGQLHPEEFSQIEELHFRCGQPAKICSNRGEHALWPTVMPKDLEEIISTACEQSVYAYTDSIAQGYLTVSGGHRLGICGHGVVSNGEIQTFRNLSSVNIRVAREVIGFADQIIPILRGSALILGPPGCGKTTLLRDLIRLISDKRRQAVSVVDERGEITAMKNGMSQMTIGSRTDVLIHVPKALGIMQMVRSMNPRWIAVDEITTPEDIAVIEQCSYCGVNFLATAHGRTCNDLQDRPLYRRLMQCGVFTQCILMKDDKTYTLEDLRS